MQERAGLHYPDPRLSDGVVVLRPWRRGDVACVEAASTDHRIPQGTTVPREFTVEGGVALVERQLARRTSGEGVSLAISVHDVAVGLVILMVRPQEGVAGIGYWVVPAARRRGSACRAIGLLTQWALTTGGFARVEAWVDPDNDPSLRALAANGYEVEGRLRAFLGTGRQRSDALVLSKIAAGRGVDRTTPQP